MKTIIAATDLSSIADDVIQKASDLARQFASHLWIIHVAAPNPGFVGLEVGPTHERDWRAKSLRDEHRAIQAAASALREQGITVTPLLIQGPTVETLLQESAKLDANLIVVGSHGHSAIYDLLVGTVTEALLRQAPCPILVIPSRKERTVSSDS